MAKKIAVVLLVLVSFQVFGWGLTGHRTVGEIATGYLSKKAKKKLDKILEHRSLAEVSNWMDEIKSDDRYDHTHDWHWVTIPTGMAYEETEKNPNGDIIKTIERLISELKAGGLTREKEAEHVMMLVHLIGDIHQPLHVGTGEDKGGNDVRVKWFWDNSNLHRVWDSGMIDGKKYSFTELAEAADNYSEETIEQWQNSTVRDWAQESMALRDQVYDLPEDKSINYEYQYKNWNTVKRRLAQAGARLAQVLNEIYG